MLINDGLTNKTAHVDNNNQIHTFSVTETEAIQATDIGDAYNINTGKITLTSDANHALLYFKNNESRAFVVEAIAVGVNSAGTTTDDSEVTIIRNPTAGTIVDNTSAVAMNQNRNFSSSRTLADSIAYKGANGYTFTDGDDIALLFMDEGSRLYANLGFELGTGNSIGVELDPNFSSGTVTCYAAIIGYLKNSDNA
jgi:hypothetical protein